MTDNFHHISLQNLGVIASKLPKPLFDKVMKEIREIQRTWPVKDEYNKQLAGNIKREYRSEKIRQIIAPFLESLGREYQDYYDYYPDANPILDSTWVNYQKKNEINPVHNHTGILSYVAWMQIPYTMEEEEKEDSVKDARIPYPSYFSFLYSTILGPMHNHPLPVEKGWEGRLVLFPAKLNHMVTAFRTSDDYRISISGNLS